MLPEPHRQSYQSLQACLQTLHTLNTEANPEPATLVASLQQVQQIFQTQVSRLSLETLASAADEQRCRAYQTEIHKELRLLAADLCFLQAARKPETVQQRRAQLAQRLETLIRYCSAVQG